MGYKADGKPPYFSSSDFQDITNVLSQKGLHIRVEEKLGKGSFAKVYRGAWCEDSYGFEAHSPVAIKLIDLRHSRPKMNEKGVLVPPKWLRRETETQLAQDHDNLVRVIAAFIDTLPYALLLEYCAGGPLHDLVNMDISDSLERLGWQQRIKVASDIACGMAHLHSQLIMHRDLKPQNILFKDRVLSINDVVQAKVCDFGLARYYGGDHCSLMTHKTGSWQFMAPEVIVSGDGDTYDEKVDVYSYAMVIFVMLVGFDGFGSMGFHQLSLLMCQGGRPKVEVIPDTAPDNLRLLMLAAWEEEPSNRPTFVDIAEKLKPILL
jgi:serine/threonine protein kinase